MWLHVPAMCRAPSLSVMTVDGGRKTEDGRRKTGRISHGARTNDSLLGGGRRNGSLRTGPSSAVDVDQSEPGTRSQTGEGAFVGFDGELEGGPRAVGGTGI